MGLKVEISPGAFLDIDEIVAYIRSDASLSAARCVRDSSRNLHILRSFLGAYPLAPENEHCDFEVRQFVFGRYRILFTTDDDSVYVLTVRHGARQLIGPQQLEERHPNG